MGVGGGFSYTIKYTITFMQKVRTKEALEGSKGRSVGGRSK